MPISRLTGFTWPSLPTRPSDQVRRQEVKVNDLLKNSRHIWLKRPENPTVRRKDKLEMLQRLNFSTAKAYSSRILNYFPDRLTNGLMEGINSLIQAAKAKARGYRNTSYFKTIIYLIAAS